MKILCVLYDDPKDGMPKNYPLSELPELKKYPDGMTPHTSGTSLSAQARYAAGTREILECFFDDVPIRTQYLILPIIDLGYTLCLFCKLEDQSVDQVHPSQMMEEAYTN